ncbi:hypothetical protein SAMN05444369_1117 [Capnocytophaga haemolytica]|uniref:Uncharacterized protein n=1 Tax=Capnocytophaga haemolytica TaxID=45243 RepID=A0AAX2H2J6_9FLAO|nr:hypothetical protein SAMN05444369_1117 [Capnocytophaga haemolytica]SNV14013.1 Uncharacterised protein [Capnocytophaga haemolytica]
MLRFFQREQIEKNVLFSDTIFIGGMYIFV